MTTLLAYSKGISKSQFVAETKAHQLADNFIKGVYSRGKKGCAVGCAIKSINKLKRKRVNAGDHGAYEDYLGIPTWLALLEDRIFEGLPLARSKTWPVEFAESINEDSDLSTVEVPFKIVVLEYNIKIQQANLANCTDEKLQKIIQQVINVTQQMITALNSGDRGFNEKAWSAASSAARSAAELAGSAATYLAARSAASSARSAAWSAASSAAWSAARSAADPAYIHFADELLKLLRGCK